MAEEILNFDEDDYIHNWFGLTYANYLVLPRSILQSMDAEWQKKLVNLLNELEDKMNKEGLQDMPDYKVIKSNCEELIDKLSKMREEYLQDMPDYSVNAKVSNGKYIKDPYRYYWRNNQRINGLVDVFGIDKEQFEKDWSR